MSLVATKVDVSLPYMRLLREQAALRKELLAGGSIAAVQARLDALDVELAALKDADDRWWASVMEQSKFEGE